jgi:SAM-dependent methyltransferase
LIEIGAGYGRLVPLYAGYDEVVLFDHAMSQLRQAQELWGDVGPAGRPRYTYVAGDFYKLPFASGVFDTLTMVRTLHHAASAPSVLRGVSDILAPGGAFILEFANKRNLKAILRYFVRRQDWVPFEREPVEFVKLNFDFHPAWMRDRLTEAGLQVRKMRTVSHFRAGFLKRWVPTALLVAMDRILQPTGEFCQLSPSVFVQSLAPGDAAPAVSGEFFRCPVCGSTGLEDEGEALDCTDCGARFSLYEGVYDFRRPRGGG